MNLFLVKINFSLKFDNISVLYAHKKHSLYKKRLSLIDLQLPFFPHYASCMFYISAAQICRGPDIIREINHEVVT